MHNINSAKYISSVKEEYGIIRNGSGIRIIADAAVIQLEGKDILDFLHRISTNAVKDLKPFEKKNTLFLNEKGRFIDRTTLLNLESFFILIGSTDRNKRLYSWINKYIIMEDIQTKDVTDNSLVIELIGPQSESYITLLIGDEMKRLNNDNVINTYADGFSFILFKDNLNGKNSFWILIEKERGGDFVEYMLQNKSVFDVGVVNSTAYDVARIECGCAVFPNEINDSYNPHETNLINEVSFTKGCYIGQEIIARLDTYDKVQKKMVGFLLPENIILNGTSTLFDDDENEAGEITSHAFSEWLGKKIALGFVRRKILKENKPVYAVNDKSKLPITICELPFKK